MQNLFEKRTGAATEPYRAEGQRVTVVSILPLPAEFLYFEVVDSGRSAVGKLKGCGQVDGAFGKFQYGLPINSTSGYLLSFLLITHFNDQFYGLYLYGRRQAVPTGNGRQGGGGSR